MLCNNIHLVPPFVLWGERGNYSGEILLQILCKVVGFEQIKSFYYLILPRLEIAIACA